MSCWPWEPPPPPSQTPSQTPFAQNSITPMQFSNDSSDNIHTLTSTDHNVATTTTTIHYNSAEQDDKNDPHVSPQSGSSLGDLNIVLSFLNLEKTASLSVGEQKQGSHSMTDTSNIGDLGDLSRILRYLQAHKSSSLPYLEQNSQMATESPTFISAPTPLESLTIDTNFHSFDEPHMLTSPDISSLTLPANILHPSQGTQEAPFDDDDCNESTTNRRRAKKKATKNELPIDEPSSCSGGGGISSESDHKEAHDTIIEVDEKSHKRNHLPDTAVIKAKVSDYEQEPQSGLILRNINAKKKRPWRSERVLKEMKTLFMVEQQQEQQRQQQKQQKQQQQQQQQQHRQKALMQTRIQNSAAKYRLKAKLEDNSPSIKDREHDSDEFEEVMEQLPGCDLTVTRRPRSHYKNFWRTTSHNEEQDNNPQTLTTSTQCMSEEQKLGKRLLAMRIRDTLHVPIGKSLRDQAISQMNIDIMKAIQLSDTEDDTSSDYITSITGSENAVDKLLSSTESRCSGPNLSKVIVEEEEKVDDSPSNRVFIFVDNSNILTGFYQHQQRHTAAQNNVDHSPPKPRPTRPVRNCSSECPSQTQDDNGKFPTSVEQVITDSEEEIILYPRSAAENIKSAQASTSNDAISSASDDPATSREYTAESAATNPNSHHEEKEEAIEEEEPQSKSPKQNPSSGARMVKGKFPKFNYAAFFNLLRRNRFAARKVLVGSSPLFQELDVAMEHHYETIILRRVRKFVQGELGALPIPVKHIRYPNNNMEGGVLSETSGEGVKEEPSTAHSISGARGEQGVDELLHLKMLETLLDHEPATMVLATGDGGDSEFGGGGFYGVIKRALDRGWQVEVVSWEDPLSGVYLELALEYGYESANDRSRHRHRASQSNQHHHRPQDQRQNSRQHQRGWHEDHKRGHLRVWCLDWYGEQYFSTTNNDE